MEKYYVSGCIEIEGTVGHVEDEKAEFFTLYERKESGLSHALLDCVDRLSVEAAMAIYIERDAHLVAEMVWEKTMMETIGEDGVGSVKAAFEKLQSERDSLQEQVQGLKDRLHLVAELNVVASALHVEAEKQVRALTAEAELARRDAAAGGPVLDPQAIGWVDSEELRSIDKNRHATIYKIEPDNPYHDPRRQKLVYLAPPAASAPDGLAAAVNQLLDSDGSRGTFSAIRRGDALAEVERLLATAPAPGGDCGDQG
ncbi:hypothetical protein JNO12_13780 [Erwinia aphidicola]|nr:hypothetical protein [Erwinia aphidicola]